MANQSLQRATEECRNLTSEMVAIENHITRARLEIAEIADSLEQVRGRLYNATLREMHIREIYRLAEVQFPRLLRTSALREIDVFELEKWIGRAKSVQALVDIVEALKELSKYQPSDIKSNLYALAQKIIIEGAYGQKSKKR